jgi:HEPN domain-containing protein
MNDETVKKWFEKADNDYTIALESLDSGKPVPDMICFHAQQCVEKYLKGFLLFHDREIEKTHKLSALIQSCEEINSLFSELRIKRIDALTPYATTYRYPDDFYIPTIDEAKNSLNSADFVRSFVRNAINDYNKL